MDLLQQLLDEHGSSLIQALTAKAGFTPDQAKKFVPAAAQQSFDKIQSGAVDAKALLEKGDVSALIDKLDLTALGKKVGIDPALAKSGLKTILPMILGYLKQKGVDPKMVEALLGGQGGLGGLTKMVGKMFGKS